MSDEQPRAEWIFPEEKKSNKKRIWLIVVLSVVAIAIVAALLFMFLPRGDGAPGASPSPSSSASSTPTSTASEAPPSTPFPEPTETAVAPPQPVDPDTEAFRAQIGPVLDDALTGLGFVSAASGAEESLSILDSLTGDAQRLSTAVAPSSIQTQWTDGVDAYAQSLAELRDAVTADADVPNALEAAQQNAENLRELVGM